MSSFLAWIEGALRACWRWLGIAANLALLAIMFGVSADAVLRYAFNRPVAGTLEGVELLLVFAVFLSLAATQAARGHVAVDIVAGRLRGKPRAALQAFTAALGVLLFAVVSWATGDMAIRSWQMGESAAGLIPFPIYPSRTLVALGSLLLAIELLCEFARALVSLCGRPMEADTDPAAPAQPLP
ncbi:MAG: TRAP transporter small permease subunit [Betaproteobacteria bacterium]|nr:TRAP transporter small permease subunit [Betaproteobacteria bacterium]MBK8107072.1 TRAP transporter small permease subunit [Betaproteobacteria bacterium]